MHGNEVRWKAYQDWIKYHRQRKGRSTMRLIATTTFDFQGKTLTAGSIFDAPDDQANVLINQDLAHRFHLEDPSTLNNPQPVIEPPEEPLPDVPPVTIEPTEATMPAEGGSGVITVTMTGPGTSGTWTVDKDADATWLSYMPDTPQSVDGDIDYAVDVNTDTAERTGNLYINGKTFTVTQDAAAVEPAAAHHGRRHSKG
jgi:Putative binding domain, N-terminal